MTAPGLTSFTFNEPTAGGGDFEPTPIAQDCVGYVCVIRPKSIDDTATYKSAEGIVSPRPVAILDVLILDASSISPEFKPGPIAYNAATQKSLPPTDVVSLPAYFEGVSWAGVNVVRTLRDELAAHPINPLLLAFVHHGQGTRGNPPVNIGKLSVNQWGQPREPQIVQAVNQMAEHYWSQVVQGTFQAPVSQLIQPPPHANPEALKRYEARVKSRELAARRDAAAQLGFQPPTSDIAAYNPASPVPTYAQPTSHPYAQLRAQQPAASTWTPAPGSGVITTPAATTYTQPTSHPYAETAPAWAPAPQSVSTPQAPPQGLPVPEGHPEYTGAWATLPEAAKQAVYASLGLPIATH